MNEMSRAPVLVLITIALVLGAVAILREGRDDAPPRAPEPPKEAPTEDATSVSAHSPETTEAPSFDAADLADRRAAGGPAGERADRLPTRIEYPVLAKYASQSFSDVPHRIVGAVDEREDEREGERRLFVAVVAPERTDAEIEALVRDLQVRHRDARVLRVRVFDADEAAARPSWTDGGAERDAHLVAELIRDPSTTRLRVRNREVAP